MELTSDLKTAKIYYSVLGNEKSKKSTHIALGRAKGYIRKLIGERVKLRCTPEINFQADSSQEYSQRIEDLIDKIHREDEARKPDAGSR